MRSNIIKKIIISFGIVVGMAGIGFILLVLAYKIPVERINENLKKSVHVFENEGAYPTVNYTFETRSADGRIVNTKFFSDLMLDNFTDSLMLMAAGCKEDDNAVKNALLCNHYKFSNTPVHTFIEVYGDDSNTDVISYSRYWHGYLVLLKPLLLFVGYGGVRKIMSICQIVLVSLTVISAWIKRRPLYIIPLIITYIFLSPSALHQSMQYNTIFVITYLQILLILLNNKIYKNKDFWIYHFVIVGCVVAYFDYLTYPLVAFGIPFILLISNYGEDFKENLKDLIMSGASWSFGYLGMWISKWILATLLTGENVIKDASTQIGVRTSGSVKDKSHVYIMGNATVNNVIVVKWFLPLLIVLLLFVVVFLYKEKNHNTFIIYCVVMLLPIAWYTVCSNHSYIHCWMTYRELGISIFSASLFLVKCLEKYRISIVKE